MSKLPKNEYIDSIDRTDYESSLDNLDKVQNENNLSKSEKLKVMEAKAECFSGIGKLKKSETLYKRIISQDSEYYRAYYGLDLLYSTWPTKKWNYYAQKRIDLWKQLESVAPNMVFHLMLADAYNCKKMYNEALKYYKKAMKDEEYLWSKSDICAKMGSIYFKKEEYKKALNAYHKAVKFSQVEWGDVNGCESYFAVMREIYRRLPGDNEENVLETERLYRDSKKLRKKSSKTKSSSSSKYKELIEKIEREIEISQEVIKEEKVFKRKVANFIKKQIEKSKNFHVEGIEDVEELVDIFLEEHFDNKSRGVNIEEKFSYKVDLLLLITK